MNCVFCSQEVKNTGSLSSRELHCVCKQCGEYNITYENEYKVTQLFKLNKDLIGKEYLFKSYICNNTLAGEIDTEISEESILSIYKSGMLPESVYQKIDYILMRMIKNSAYFGDELFLDLDEYIKYYAKNKVEFQNILSELLEKQYIKKGQSAYCYAVTLSGSAYIELKKAENSDNKNCFIAMWYDKELLEVFNNSISDMLKSNGYNPVIIANVEHNDNITDRIISEIKKCKFIIADLSGNRGGVYFEAGYAMGMNKQIIWTCNEKYFNKTVKKHVAINENGYEREIEIDEYFKIHFDIDHYNFIIWKDEKDLSERLKNRIEATIG